MQPKSIHEPVRVENERTPATFPESGNNFTTLACLDRVQDPLALLEAFALLQDFKAALAEFEREQAGKKPG